MTNDPNLKLVPMKYVSAMIDEIYMLRAHCAQQALHLRVQAGGKSVSQKRKKELQDAAERLERAAQGDAEGAWPRDVVMNPQTYLKYAGADDMLNFPVWRDAFDARK